jgi:MFS family permease
MTKAQRRYLAYIAIYFAGFMAVIFDYIAENRDYQSEWRRLYVAALFSAPVWLPVLIPSRFILLSRVTRWLCAVGLAFYFPIWGTLVSSSFRRVLAGSIAGIAGFVSSTAGLAGCLAAIVLLVWPEIGRFLKRTPNKSVEPTVSHSAVGGG